MYTYDPDNIEPGWVSIGQIFVCNKIKIEVQCYKLEGNLFIKMGKIKNLKYKDSEHKDLPAKTAIHEHYSTAFVTYRSIESMQSVKCWQ